jgi:uncharacterized repeat protein (TIGR01451 family)
MIQSVMSVFTAFLLAVGLSVGVLYCITQLSRQQYRKRQGATSRKTQLVWRRSLLAGFQIRMPSWTRVRPNVRSRQHYPRRVHVQPAILALYGCGLVLGVLGALGWLSLPLSLGVSTCLAFALLAIVMMRFIRLRAWVLTGLLLFSILSSLHIELLHPQPAQAATETIAAGAYVIDMGQATQTLGNSLKPYGLVYELIVKKGIPVKWAINPTKARDGADFTAGSKTYSGGSFIIPAEYATEAAASITAWKLQGVVVDGPTTAAFTAPIYTNLDNFPNTVLDSQNGAIAQAYFTNAGIPASTTGTFGSFTTYQFLPPSALNACHDVYVMPHADPAWSTHNNLLPFNQGKGFIWAACHAVSVLERVDDPGDAGTLPDLNFLSHVPPAVQDSLSLKLFGSHVAPSAGPYTYPAASATALPYGYGTTNLAAYPIMQFMGKIDLATQNGSEQLYVPESTAQWRDSTAIATFDSTATAADPGLNTNSQDKAVKMVFGPGFGNATNGLVMYEAGHSHAKGTAPDNIAAQRAFLNFILLAGVVRGIDVNFDAPASIAAGQTVNLNANATGGTGIFQYQWYSSCGGTFSNPTGATTNFTAPTTPTTACKVRVAVTDTCNRKAIGTDNAVISGPAVDLEIRKDDGQTIAKAGSPITYTITVKNNGPTTVNSLKVTDNYPATIQNPTFTPSTGAFSFNPTTKDGTWTGLNLAAGQSITLLLKGTVDPNAAVNSTLRNTATVAPLGGVTDTNSANDSSTDTDTIAAPQANITVSKDDSVTQTSDDGNLTYTIKVTNNGPDTITNLLVEDQIIRFKDDPATPAKGIDTNTAIDKAGKDVMDNLSLVVSQGMLSPSPTAFANNTTTVFSNNLPALTWQNVNLAPSQTAILIFSGKVKVDNSQGALQNTVKLTPQSATGATIGTSTTASDIDELIAKGVEVALKITKTANPTNPIPGNNMTYSLLVENSKNAADAVRILDTLPTAITNITWTCATTAGTAPATQCNQPSGTVNTSNTLDTTANLANGGKVTYTITGKLDPSFTGSLSNTATANPKPGQWDNTPADNTSTVTSTIARNAALVVTKSDGLTMVAPGQAVSYTITVQNKGPSTINSVKLTDVMPNVIQNPTFGVNQGSFNPTVTTGTPNNTWVGDWANLNLIPGNTATDTVTLTVSGTLNPAAPAGTNNLTNSVAIAAPTSFPNPVSYGAAYTVDTPNSTLTASDTDSIQPIADLEVSKTDGITQAIPGTAIGYIITVKNNGPNPVTSVKLTDAVPAAILNSKLTGPDGATLNATSGYWDGLTLNAGDSATFILEGTLDPAATGTLSNTATVATPAGITDPTPANNSSTDTDTLKPTADLSITKTDGTTAINPGEAITYTLRVTNNGPSHVTGATVTDTVPAQITTVTWSCAVTTGTGSCGAPTGSGNAINTTVNLLKGATATYTVQGTVSSSATVGSTLDNTAQVAPPAGVTDSVSANDSSTDTDTIGRPTGTADLAIAKTNNLTSVVPGDPITYTITVTNNGPGTVESLTVTDPLPVDLVDPFFSTPDGTYDSTTGQWSGFTLAPGNSIVLTVDGTLSIAPTTSRLKNTATVTPAIGFTDANPTNDSATDDDPIQGASAPANILLVKRITAVNGQTTNDGKDLATYIDTASPYDDNAVTVTDPAQPKDTDKWPTPLTTSLKGEVNAGNVKPDDEIEYTIYFLSAGDRDAKQVKLCDPLPSNITYTAGSLSLAWGSSTQALTDVGDADKGQYFAPGITPQGLPSQATSCQNHTNGVVVVNLGDVPKADTPGTPLNAYGYIRIRGRVK